MPVQLALGSTSSDIHRMARAFDGMMPEAELLDKAEEWASRAHSTRSNVNPFGAMRVHCSVKRSFRLPYVELPQHAQPS